jgi:hypothetical protein
MQAKLQTALVGALPVTLFSAAKAMMFADSFVRADGEHLRMLESLYDTVSSDGAGRSIHPPTRTPTGFPK